ncbi:Rha family transcriptional regulator [Lysinibacillus sphaericus]|uniref:Rha family transcriptional regulator n=1 Tax=Lysinibacillus sphaericus TaxID=1421 RepID=UPI001E564361|nr:Rha family transcriptional regulator [Lysinibacillus sphaericus]
MRSLKCSNAFRLANFGEAEYVNGQGKMPMYVLTFNGFAVLAMGYTGEKAMQFKELYIEEFDRTHRLLADLQVTLLSKEQKMISLAVRNRILLLYPNLSIHARKNTLLLYIKI